MFVKEKPDKKNAVMSMMTLQIFKNVDLSKTRNLNTLRERNIFFFKAKKNHSSYSNYNNMTKDNLLAEVALNLTSMMDFSTYQI